MRRLGHHLYTSFGGQRTVYISPWLQGWQPWLEQRAHAMYGECPCFDVVAVSGLRVGTFVVPNGVDHVGRPRQLVHQVAIEDSRLPGLFSPLMLMHAILPRLEHEDPGIAQRVVADFDDLPPAKLMPDPKTLVGLLKGDLRSVAAGVLSALSCPGAPVHVSVAGLFDHLSDVAAVSSMALLHHPGVHLTSATAPPLVGEGMPMVRFRNVLRTPGPLDSDPFMEAEPAAAWVIDALTVAEDVPRLVALLRRVPLATLLDPRSTAGLRRALFRPGLRLAADGTPVPGTPGADELSEVLTVLRSGTTLFRASDRLSSVKPPGALP